jgi:hypothetical protein
MAVTGNDNDKYREKRQDAYFFCCVEAYGLVAEALRHLGVAGGDDNHNVIKAEELPLIVYDNHEEAIDYLRQAGAILYNAPYIGVPDRIGPQHLWSVDLREDMKPDPLCPY